MKHRVAGRGVRLATRPIVESSEVGALTVDAVRPEKHREEDYRGERNTK